jgi:hypothetical protein
MGTGSLWILGIAIGSISAVLHVARMVIRWCPRPKPRRESLSAPVIGRCSGLRPVVGPEAEVGSRACLKPTSTRGYCATSGCRAAFVKQVVRPLTVWPLDAASVLFECTVTEGDFRARR